MNNEKVSLGNGCTVSYYRLGSKSPLIGIEDETDLALLTPSEAQLSKQRSHLTAIAPTLSPLYRLCESTFCEGEAKVVAQ